MMKSRTAASARVYLREFWPELLCGGLLTLIGFAGQKDDVLFSVFCAIVLAIGWCLGHRHRSLSLHSKVDRMTASVGELVDEVRADREADEEPEAPVLYLATRNGDRA